MKKLCNFGIVKELQSKHNLLKLFFSRKKLAPSNFNKLLDFIGEFSTKISIFLFFLKVILVNKIVIFWFGFILYFILAYLLIRGSWKFLSYHDSFKKNIELPQKQGYKQSAKIFDRINFAKFYEKMFLSFLTIFLLFLNEDKLAISIASNKCLWIFLTAIFLLFNTFLLFLAKHINLIKNYIIKYWTYCFLITNILSLIAIMLFFPICQYTSKVYELYVYYFIFLLLEVFYFFIYIIFIDNTPNKKT